MVDYPFTRKQKNNISEWSAINRGLQNTLKAVIRGEYTEEELAFFCRSAIRDAESQPNDANMVFWGYDKPETMPSDARCEFFYLPTYLIVLIMVAGINRYPKLSEIHDVKGTLSRGLRACVAHNLSGSGYEGYGILLENLEMFIRAGISGFLRDYPGICDDFSKVFNEQIKAVRAAYKRGEHMAGWNQDFSAEQKEVLDLYDESLKEEDHEGLVWYVAYGSNLLAGRLKNYIAGGRCAYNKREYKPCDDTRLPERSVTVRIPYSMYYSGASKSWGEKPVCFLDIAKPGMAYGRAYLVRKAQLDWIHNQEGKGHAWYSQRVRLENIDDIPAYTFTSSVAKEHRPFNMVSASYGVVLFCGMKESYPCMSDENIFEYLISCGR